MHYSVVYCSPFLIYTTHNYLGLGKFKQFLFLSHEQSLLVTPFCIRTDGVQINDPLFCLAFTTTLQDDLA